MAVRQGLECDRCHRPKVLAKKYRVSVSEVTSTGDVVPLINQEADLCQKDLDRMLGFVSRGVDIELK